MCQRFTETTVTKSWYGMIVYVCACMRVCVCEITVTNYSWYGIIVCMHVCVCVHASICVCTREYVCMVTNYCTYPMQFLKSYPADLYPSVVESHVGALTLVIGSSVWITWEHCWYLSKEDRSWENKVWQGSFYTHNPSPEMQWGQHQCCCQPITLLQFNSYLCMKHLFSTSLPLVYLLQELLLGPRRCGLGWEGSRRSAGVQEARSSKSNSLINRSSPPSSFPSSHKPIAIF